MGEDPLNVDKLYTKMLMESAGAGAIAGVTVTAASGIEIALWDLAGRILQTPACNLLGGRFRDRVRFYRTMPAVERPEGSAGLARSGAAGARRRSSAGRRSNSRATASRRRPIPTTRSRATIRYTRGLTLKDLRRIGRAMEIVREELGPDIDFGVEAHWKYDVRDAIKWRRRSSRSSRCGWKIRCRRAIPRRWPASRTPSTSRSAPARTSTRATDSGASSSCRAATSSTSTSRNRADCWSRSGFTIWRTTTTSATAAHNPASPVGTIASCHAAASMRDFRVHELARYIDWWQDLVIHDGPIFEDGYFTIQDKPGYGIEINPDVAKAHLAPGETWWG